MTTRTAATIDVAGERLMLLADRAIFWPAGDSLFIADPHVGKTAAFRAAAVPVPGGTTATDLDRLARLIESTHAQRLVILGDFFHARAGTTPAVLDALRGWRDHHADLDILLVRGNHDWRSGDPPADLRFTVVDEPAALPPFALYHHPADPIVGYGLAGHIHPAVRLRGRGDRLMLPCFHFTDRLGILPAFGSFTGTAIVASGPADRVFVIAGDEVVDASR